MESISNRTEKLTSRLESREVLGKVGWGPTEVVSFGKENKFWPIR